jgi:hypothetical protein
MLPGMEHTQKQKQRAFHFTNFLCSILEFAILPVNISVFQE